MIKIKFSHHYTKMPPDFNFSRLLRIELVKLEKLPKDFLDSDTEIDGGGHYPLPKKGNFMILWLTSDIMNNRWQTIRRWTPQKEAYYRKHVGELIEAVIVPSFFVFPGGK